MEKVTLDKILSNLNSPHLQACLEYNEIREEVAEGWLQRINEILSAVNTLKKVEKILDTTALTSLSNDYRFFLNEHAATQGKGVEFGIGNHHSYRLTLSKYLEPQSFFLTCLEGIIEAIEFEVQSTQSILRTALNVKVEF